MYTVGQEIMFGVQKAVVLEIDNAGRVVRFKTRGVSLTTQPGFQIDSLRGVVASNEANFVEQCSIITVSY